MPVLITVGLAVQQKFDAFYCGFRCSVGLRIVWKAMYVPVSKESTSSFAKFRYKCRAIVRYYHGRIAENAEHTAVERA